MSDLGNKEIMSNNIQYYMKKFDVNRRKLSSDLNIKYTTLSDWINAKTYPRIDKIELLANYFNIQKADLVESKNNGSQSTDILSLDKKIAINIKELRTKKNLPKKNIADKLGISIKELTLYEEQQKPFTIDVVFNFAKALDVTFDDLFPTEGKFDEIPAILKIYENENKVETASGEIHYLTDEEMIFLKNFLIFTNRK